MRKKKLGAVLLSSLIIGPILGSGIILLPPLIYKTTGDYAIIAWLLIMGIGFLFASLFGKLSILFPSESGVAHAVDQAFGPSMKQLTSIFFIIAGCLGPTAVLMTASQYIAALFSNFKVPLEGIGFLLMCLCVLILLLDISSIGKISFVFSTAATVLLLSGGIRSIPHFRSEQLVQTSFSFGDFGYSILLLFWALVGWEIIGNYSMDVKNRKKTIPQAITISTLTVTVVCLVVAGATQWIVIPSSHQEDLRITAILATLFGEFAVPLIAFITTVLCMSTYLLVVGGVSRLIASEAKYIKKLYTLSYRTKSNVSIYSLLFLIGVHTIVFICLYNDFITVEQIVAIANAFFICNAICGIFAAYKLLPGLFNKILSLSLIVCFLIILSFSSIWILISIGILVGFYGLQYFKNRPNTYEKEISIR
ncbi:amino acid permease [Bacillus pseudomycoides]|uniref:APC family permease n=1 Tax=Bacillus pseudomycoides TaxID=64104 RepID=UPI000BEF94EA|nr:amino acid permease [Bacillus pseudomycoides]PEK30892.1 amino acid permease [Bacillus pseudomycoides]PEK66560.1 amino acid permease [Bacillus pseudomycoides]PEP36315.1 amino acid permease [Bacillus pseudomycoides]PEP45310.1 amino acid permease [Bacillus pseudomycoides]PFX48356.1 amino acid permease [Bacillus pseudomycoides]